MNFECACGRNIWIVKKINATQGVIECTQCITRVLVTVEMIEFSV